MVRPKKIRIIYNEPKVTYFKPRAVPLSQLEEVELNFDEIESLRFSEIDKLNQSEAALKMNIHQSTFQRMLSKAREKIADALINGKAIKIQGGEYKISGKDETRPFGRGRGQGFQLGTCVCPNCGHEETHIRGQPCNHKKCPKCETIMTRK